jgi:Polyketide cyclase / dehydrase and lipid transport
MKKSVIFASVVGILGVATAATFTLPQTVTLERRAVVAMAPDAVLALAASNQGYQKFNPYKNTDAGLKVAMFGPAAGIGSGFSFNGKDGQGSQTVVEVAAHKVGYQIDMGAMGRPTQAIIARPHARGSEVTWSMSMDMGNNPLMRVMGLAMDGMMGSVLETGLANFNKISKST